MSDSPSLEERIALLEVENAGLKRVGVLLLVFVIVVGGLSVFQFRSLTSSFHTETLQLERAKSPRAALTVMPTDHLGLVFYDHLGLLPTELKFGAIPYLDGLAIYDRNGNPRILIGLNDKDEPILAVVSADGQTLFQAVEPASDSQTEQPSSPEGTEAPAEEIEAPAQP